MRRWFFSRAPKRRLLLLHEPSARRSTIDLSARQLRSLRRLKRERWLSLLGEGIRAAHSRSEGRRACVACLVPALLRRCARLLRVSASALPWIAGVLEKA